MTSVDASLLCKFRKNWQVFDKFFSPLGGVFETDRARLTVERFWGTRSVESSFVFHNIHRVLRCWLLGKTEPRAPGSLGGVSGDWGLLSESP